MSARPDSWPQPSTLRRLLAFAPLALAIGCASRRTPAPALFPIEEFRRSEDQGRVLVLAFWASWCTHCRELAPWLAELSRALPAADGRVVGLSEDHEAEPARGFIAATGLPFRNYHDVGGRLAKELRVMALPTVVLIDRAGRVRHRFAGDRPQEAAQRIEAVRALVNERPQP